MKKTQRQLQKEQTRKRLLEVAFSEFGSRGIMATRMSDIAKAAGVSHGTVFAHYETQEALIIAVIEEFGEKITRQTHELINEIGGVHDVLTAHLKGLIEFEAFYSRLIIEARFLPQVARDTLVTIQSAISFHLSQAAEREMKTGKIKPMPVYLLFNTWMGLINYYIINSDLFAPQGDVLRRYGTVLLEHYMNLIRKEK